MTTLTPPANPSLGINLSAIGIYSTGLQTLDLMKGADPWEVMLPTKWGAIKMDLDRFLDAEGWPTSLPTLDGVKLEWHGTVSWSTALPKGRYVISWEGEGTVDSFLNVVSRQDHRIVVEVDERWGSQVLPDAITFLIKNTDPNGTGNYVRDIKVYREEDEARVLAGEIWRPEFLDKVGDFRVLRTMELQHTNSSQATTWIPADQSMDKASWADGPPIEALIDLANTTRADLWLNIPHLADDAYVREVARLVKEKLDPSLKVYLEYSNEHWTPGFGQSKWFNEQGAAAYGGANFAGPQYYVSRAAEVAKVFGSAFGAENDERYVPLFTIASGFMDWKAYVDALLNGPDAVKKGGTAAVNGPFKAIAVDTYFDAGLGWMENRAVIKGWIAQGMDKAVDLAFEAIATGKGLPKWTGLDKYASLLKSWGDVAKQNGWELLSYEGGTGFANFSDPSDTAFTELMLRLSKDPRAAALAERVVDGFHDAGGTVLAHFADFGNEGWWGSWATWSSVFATDPLSRGVPVLEANAEAPLYADPRPGSTFLDVGLRGEPGVMRLGTAAADTLQGGALADTLAGLGGDDTLRGGDGGDRLVGGDGNDRLEGQGGADLLEGGDGNDLILGGEGADSVYAGAGDDTVAGEAGADVIVGEAGKDSLSGGDGADTIHGGDGADSLAGEQGKDLLDGGLGNDTLLGGADDDYLDGGGGNDQLDGTGGDDTLLGGDGADVFVFGRGYGSDVVMDFRPGTDRLDFTTIEASGTTQLRDLVAGGMRTNAAGDVVIELTQAGTKVTLTGVKPADLLGKDWLVGTTLVDVASSAGQAKPTAPAVNVGSPAPSVISAPLTLRGTDARDTLVGGTANDWLYGLGGADLLEGGAGNDGLSGGDGNDSILGGAGNDSAWADAGDDSVDGGAGDDSLWGGDGADTMSGGDGADTVDGAGGNDSLVGGAGNDTLIGALGNDSLVGGAGDDRIDGTWGDDRLTGGDGADVFVFDRWYGNDVVTDFTPGTDRLDLTILESYGTARVRDLVAGAMGSNATGDVVIDLQQFGTKVTLTGIKSADLLGKDWLVLGPDGAVTTPVSRVGTEGRDWLVGGTANDWLSGLGGADLLEGGAGSDGLSGGDGNDTILGGAGNDTAWAGAGEDSVDGGAGDDSLWGGDGADTMSGGDGADTVNGAGGNDVLDGGAGNDTLIGALGNDSLVGGAGDDRIDGTWGDDRLTGGDGADVFVFDRWHNNDVVTDFTPGTDRLDLTILESYGTARVRDLIAGAMGSNAAGDVVIDLQQFGTKVTLTDIKSADLLGKDWLVLGPDGAVTTPVSRVGTEGRDWLVGGTANDWLSGLGGADLLEGGAGNDGLSGGDGNDSILGGAGNDTAWAGAGEDSVDGGAGDDSLWGGDGADTMSGGDGADTVNGAGGNDVLGGGAGNDRLEGTGGDDRLTGGDGADVFVFDRWHNNDVVTDFTPGTDRLDFTALEAYGTAGVRDLVAGAMGSNAAGDVVIDLRQFGTQVTLTGVKAADLQGKGWLVLGRDAAGTTPVSRSGTEGSDWLVGGSANDWLYGRGGADLLEGGAGNDGFSGGDGNDTILAGAGNDSAWADAGDDSVDGGAGDDSLWGGDGADTMSGGDGADSVDGAGGNDVLDGGAGNDTLIGAQGNDSLVGGAGDDRIDGTWGDDRLTGGDGADVFVFDRWYNNDVVTDFTPGTDRLDLTILESFGTARVRDLVTGAMSSNAAGDVVINLHQFGTKVTLTGIKSADLLGKTWLVAGAETTGTAAGDTLVGTGFGDVLRGEGGADSLKGGGGPDALYGGAGTDTLRGEAGDDLLLGDDGGDALYGDAGADTIRGGRGNDTLSGGAGSDLFIFAPGDGVDMITDFIRGEDRLDLSAFAGPGARAAILAGMTTDASGNLKLALPASGTEIVLLGIQPGQVTLSDQLMLS